MFGVASLRWAMTITFKPIPEGGSFHSMDPGHRALPEMQKGPRVDLISLTSCWDMGLGLVLRSVIRPLVLWSFPGQFLGSRLIARCTSATTGTLPVSSRLTSVCDMNCKVRGRSVLIA